MISFFKKIVELGNFDIGYFGIFDFLLYKLTWMVFVIISPYCLKLGQKQKSMSKHLHVIPLVCFWL